MADCTCGQCVVCNRRAAKIVSQNAAESRAEEHRIAEAEAAKKLTPEQLAQLNNTSTGTSGTKYHQK